MEGKEVLVKVDGLSKKYCLDLKTSLWYGLKDLISNIKGNKKERLLRAKEFWALKDISFELRRGECLGLIGHNGAGKSTLLKILNGLINPDEGKVTIKGRVGALIELGAGFNPILTGKENIYNNGAVLGFSREEIDNKLEEIIDFAELREFIDMPVQNYSSGMKVRLGFAIAAQMEPDVLLIDEVLAVGDLGFVLKCFRTIDLILPNTAVIFVSHSMPMVARICNQILLMHHGQQDFIGRNVGKGIDMYFSKFISNNTNVVFSDDSLELLEAQVLVDNNENQVNRGIGWNKDLKIFFKFRFSNAFKSNIEFIIIIADKEQRPVASLTTNPDDFKLNSNDLQFIVTHKNNQLSKGVYAVNLAVRKRDSKQPVLRVNDVLSFQVIHEEEIWEPFLLKSSYNQID